MRASWVVSAATAFVILGASIVAFLNPFWVGFEQARLGIGQGPVLQSLPAQVDCGSAEIARIDGAILHDLILGGDFDVRFGESRCRALSDPVPGVVILTDSERSHMRDVRGVFAGFALVVVASLAWLTVAWRRSRFGNRGGWWRAVRNGAVGLAVVVAVLGAVSLVAFDAAFEVFHRVFFAPGSYDFDPRTSRLVQLFPDQFWSDTTLALGAVILVASALIAWLATRRIARIATARSGGDGATPAALRVGKAAR